MASSAHASLHRLGVHCRAADPCVYMPLQYGESVGVADWFQSFCAVFHTRAGAEAEEASPSSSKTSRRRGKKQQQNSSQVLPATLCLILPIQVHCFPFC